MKENVSEENQKSKTKKKNKNYDQIWRLRFFLSSVSSSRRLKIQGFILQNQNLLRRMPRKIKFCSVRCLGKCLLICESGIPPKNIPKDKSLLELIMIKKNHKRLGKNFDYFLKFYFCNYESIMKNIEFKLGKRSQNVENNMNLRNPATLKKVYGGSKNSKRRSVSETLRKDQISNQLEDEVCLKLSKQILNNRARISFSKKDKDTKTKGKSHLKIITKLIDYPLHIILKFGKYLGQAPTNTSDNFERFRGHSSLLAHRRVRSKSNL